MRSEHVDPFVASAFEALLEMSSARPERGAPVLRTGTTVSSRELTAIAGLRGELEGMVFCSMSQATAAKLGSAWRGKMEGAGTKDQTDEQTVVGLACSVNEMGTMLLREKGCTCSPQETMLIHGFGEPLTQVGPVLVVPLFTEFGDIDIGIAVHPQGHVQPDSGIYPVKTLASMLPQRDDPADASGNGGTMREASAEDEAQEAAHAVPDPSETTMTPQETPVEVDNADETDSRPVAVGCPGEPEEN